MKKHAHTLCISDIHIGLPYSKFEKVFEILDQWDFDHLIIVGDLFDEALRDHPFTERQRELLEKLSAIGVIFIQGNHSSPAKKEYPLIRAIPEYKWSYQGKTYLAVHGHQFDKQVRKGSKFIQFAERAVGLLEKLIGRKITHFLTRSAMHLFSRTGVCDISYTFANKASLYATTQSADIIIFGHTHMPIDVMISGIRVLNTGSFLVDPCSYVTIEADDAHLRFI
ncbi:MAG: metallophosphoesterase family protein [Candidatus Parcubacteria bacterium]|nr:metallophosphoesterase family protein [Candidatus Parcubacteria bacterium]